MKILVTGGGGFLGRHLIKMLIERGHQVESFSRSNHPVLDRLGIKSLKGDLTNYSQVLAACEGKDAIFHVASKVGMWGKWKDFYEINVKGTKNILNAAKEANVPYLIYTSTASVVFDKNDITGGNENLPYSKSPQNFYQKSKIIAEKMILSQNDIKAVALRPHLIFGEDDPHIIPKIIEAAKAGKLKKIGDGQNLVDVTYVENAAHAHILALEKLITNPKINGSAYFIGQENPVNLWEFINSILSLNNAPIVTKSISLNVSIFLGKIMEIIYGFLGILGIQKEPPMTSFIAMQLGKSHYFSQAKAKADLGYYPLVSLYSAMERLKIRL
ncbi:MAG: NAD-dependent epimerase/dehydratase family protein [Bacteriovoracales bacterium]